MEASFRIGFQCVAASVFRVRDFVWFVNILFPCPMVQDLTKGATSPILSYRLCVDLEEM